MKVMLIRIAVIAGAVALWQMASGRFIDAYFISSPSAIVADLKLGFSDGQLLSDVGTTMTEAALGLLLGMLLGSIVGLVFAFMPLLDKVMEPIIGAANAVPRPALAPLFVLWFGLGMTSKVLVALSLVFFVAFYNAYQGVKSIDQDVINSIRVMKARRVQTLRFVVLPAVFSWVFAAFKLSVGYSLVGAIIGEFVGATSGLGYQLAQAQGLLNTDRVFSIVVLTGVVATVILFAAGRVEKAVLKWRPEAAVA
ncbi:MAG TPA: ABC transporter permease [Nocardioides sp.]|nr:ABC transporter permease [Nocardioides sp.]